MRRAYSYSQGGELNGAVRDPVTAGLLSVVPGLGQFYNGDNRKGFLFLDVGAINLVLLWFMLFSSQIVNSMRAFASAFHMRADEGVLRALEQVHLGSPVATILMALVLGFAAFAVRDAYDTAMLRRRRALYPDAVIDIPEATSGSYLLHLAMILSCCVVAVFFIAPRVPRSQVTEIEFVTTQEKTEQPKVARTKAENAHVAQGQVDPKHVVETSSGSTSASSSAHLKNAPRNISRSTSTHTAEAKTDTSPARPQPAVPKEVEPAIRPMPVLAPRVQPAGMPSPVMPSLNHVSQPSPIMPTPGHAVSGASAPTPALPAAPNAMAVPALPGPSRVAIASAGLPKLPAMSATGANSAQPVPGAPMPLVPGANASPSVQPGLPAPMPAPEAASTGKTGPGRHEGPAPQRAQRTDSGDGPTLAALPNVGASDRGEPRKGNTDTPGRAGPAHPPTAPVDFAQYMAKLQRRIKQSWSPEKAPTSKRTVVAFRVTPEGELLDLKLTRSSGVAEVDEAAMKAVRNAAPLPHLPAGADEPVDIEFTFDYNVFGGSYTNTHF